MKQYLARTAEKETFWLSVFGSIRITMSAVASGKRDWAFSLSGSVWDYAPVYLILKEAGCRVTGLDGKSWKFGNNGMVVGNPHLQPRLLKLVRKALRIVAAPPLLKIICSVPCAISSFSQLPYNPYPDWSRIEDAVKPSVD